MFSIKHKSVLLPLVAAFMLVYLSLTLIPSSFSASGTCCTQTELPGTEPVNEVSDNEGTFAEDIQDIDVYDVQPAGLLFKNQAVYFVRVNTNAFFTEVSHEVHLPPPRA